MNNIKLIEFLLSPADEGAKLLSHETTKTSLAFSKPPLPNVMEAQSIATALDAACMNLATVAASLPVERGTILFTEVQDATLAVFKTLVPVIISIRDKIDKGSEPEHAQGMRTSVAISSLFQS